MKKNALAVLFCVVAFTVAYAQGRNPMREGRWEVTIQMNMPGMQMPPMKNTQCITKAMVDDPNNAGLPSGSPDRNNQCKVSNYKIDGNKVTWTMACKDMNGSGEVTYVGDAYDGTMKVTSAQMGEMTMKMSGKRLGDCTQ